MQVAGYISTPLELKTVEGHSFHQFRLAVLSGRAEARKTAWFTVRAQLSELDADMLEKGQRVEVTGVLSLRAYLTRDSKPAVDAIIDTQQVTLAPPAPRTTPAAPPAPPAAAARPPAPTPAAAPAKPVPADAATSVLRPTVPELEEEPLPF
jgi:single-stranded DNA-binding protein